MKLGIVFFFLAWSFLMSAVVTTFMAGHWVTLPAPKIGQTLQTEIAKTDGKFIALHVLYADCPCSQRIADRLLKRNAIPGCHEKILFIGTSSAKTKQLVKNGFEIECLSPDELFTKYSIESAPLLVVTNIASGEIHYSGGYTSRKQGLDVMDEQVINQILQGKSVQSNPVFGCGVSEELQQRLDPLGWKY